MEFFKFKRHHYFVLMVLVILALYWPLITQGTLTSYDDQMLVNAVTKIKNLKDYIPAILNGNILDVQPLRDLSYQVDLWIGKFFHVETFYFINALLLFLMGLLLAKFLEEKKDSEGPDHLAHLLALVFIASPLVMSSAGWIAARKHLLAALFILLANYTLIKKRTDNKNILLIVVFYALSMLSHPINLFWPLFAILYSKFVKKENIKRMFFSLGTAFVFFLALNIVYYESVFVKWSAGDGKFEAENAHNVGLSLLAMGRYFFTTLNPFDYLPTSFFEGAWENLAGLLALTLTLLWLLKKYRHNMARLLPLLLFFLPLLPVTLSITRIFASQTYLLSSVPGVLLFLRRESNEKRLRHFALAYIVLNIAASLHYASVLGHTDSLIRFAYGKEKSPINIIGAIYADIRDHKHAEAELKIDELSIYEPKNRFISYFRVQNIYGNPVLTQLEKTQRLEKNREDVPYYYLVLSLLYANQGHSEEFKKTILNVYAPSEKYTTNSYLDNEKVLALYRLACEKYHFEEKCRPVYLDFSKKTQLKNWDPDKYARIYNELSKYKDNLTY